MSDEGGFAGFSADYLTEPPSRDKTTLQEPNRPPGTKSLSQISGWVASILAWTKITSGWMVTLLLGAVKLLTICSRPLGASNFSIRPRPQGSSVEKE